MPLKNGKLNPRERIFIEKYAATGDGAYAAEKAGYPHPHARAHDNLAKPAIAAEIRTLQAARLNNTLYPLALDTVENILRSDKATERGKLMAAKIVLDKVGGMDGSAAKEPSEMSAAELQAAIDSLRREASDRAKPVQVIEHEPEAIEEGAESGVFD